MNNLKHDNPGKGNIWKNEKSNVTAEKINFWKKESQTNDYSEKEESGKGQL